MSSMGELIRLKRDGQTLSESQIRDFVDHVTTGSAQECQIGAMLMAMYIRGLSNTEIAEIIDYLRGSTDYPDLGELVTTLGGEMLVLKGRVSSLSEGVSLVAQAVASGSALSHFEKMLICQGVTSQEAFTLCRGGDILPRAPYTTNIAALSSGYVSDIDGLAVAEVCKDLGAGRSRADQKLDLRVGAVVLRRHGESVQEGEFLIRVHHSREQISQDQLNRLCAAFSITPEPPQKLTMVIGSVSSQIL